MLNDLLSHNQRTFNGRAITTNQSVSMWRINGIILPQGDICILTQFPIDVGLILYLFFNKNLYCVLLNHIID